MEWAERRLVAMVAVVVAVQALVMVVLVALAVRERHRLVSRTGAMVAVAAMLVKPVLMAATAVPEVWRSTAVLVRAELLVVGVTAVLVGPVWLAPPGVRGVTAEWVASAPSSVGVALADARVLAVEADLVLTAAKGAAARTVGLAISTP